ncbi:MAG TPA: sigma-70 family RNA polymerase sigma factor [Actinoallomurus sp.]|nr:sigma-70 family RNA polymerase sigma factor [Actinoallomurus sp.]
MIDPVERFTVLYDRHYRNVLGYVLLRAEQGAAEDVVSETFLVAWRRLDDLPDPVLPWLLGVARNLLHKQYDSGRRRQVLAERITAATTPGDLAGPDVAENVVERDSARAVLSALSEKDVEAVVLTTWYGLSPREAARVVGCSATTFTVRVHRARKRLARTLYADTAPPPAGRGRRVAMVHEETR